MIIAKNKKEFFEKLRGVIPQAKEEPIRGPQSEPTEVIKEKPKKNKK